MSFSEQVKEELFEHKDTKVHCQVAECAAIVKFGGKIAMGEQGETILTIGGEKGLALRKCFTFLQKNISIGAYQARQSVVFPEGFSPEIFENKDGQMLSRECCKRAYLRGAFLAIGSMSDPTKSYHLEFVCNNTKESEELKTLLEGFGIDAKVTSRKKYSILYLKEGAAISDLLNVMGAHVSLMEFENDRIVKSVRGSVNRQVNCETANIAKTAQAAARQVEDIRLIDEKVGIENLPDPLREMAMIRLSEPEATLQELGDKLDPPVGKSGVNHRLRKLGQLAEKLRREQKIGSV